MNKIIVKAGQKKILPLLWTGNEDELDIKIDLVGEGAEIYAPVLLIGKDNNKLLIKAEIRHLARNTKSKIIIKAALNNKSKVDFDGRVRIEKGAVGSDAWLGAHLLLMSNQATGKAVPNLEILENDVKAGHAATVGKIDEIELFYLMSRGISTDEAKKLIVQGFLLSLIKEFPAKMKKLAESELSL